MQQGFRSAEDEPLFKKLANDPAIVPDTITPGVEGYFRIPAVWIGEIPDPTSVHVLNPQIHHALVLAKHLRCGIQVRVQRDGTFLFDFSSWSHAPQIEIPGYRIPNPKDSYKQPKETSSAESKSEEHAVLRAQVMNVHQSCVATSEKVVKRRSAQMGFPVAAYNTLKGLTFTQSVHYREDIEDVLALARNVINNKDRVPRQEPFPRRVLEIEVIEHSLELLDQILTRQDTALIQMIEAAYLAGCRSSEGRFGEALTLAWGVCEQLLSSAWDALLNDTNVDGRMPVSRKNKLTGRDYSASVIAEMLEINNRIDHKLYLDLEVARKSRNSWTHEMQEPSMHEVGTAIRCMESLFRQVKNIHLSLQLSGPRGGVPQWNIWIWESIRRAGGS